MENIIEYASLNVHTKALDKFIESDAPGALSWLYMEANDLDIDIPPFREVELRSVVPPCAGAKRSKQGIPCRLQCARCRSRQIESFDKMELRDISNPRTK